MRNIIVVVNLILFFGLSVYADETCPKTEIIDGEFAISVASDDWKFSLITNDDGINISGVTTSNKASAGEIFVRSGEMTRGVLVIEKQSLSQTFYESCLNRDDIYRGSVALYSFYRPGNSQKGESQKSNSPKIVSLSFPDLKKVIVAEQSSSTAEWNVQCYDLGSNIDDYQIWPGTFEESRNLSDLILSENDSIVTEQCFQDVRDFSLSPDIQVEPVQYDDAVCSSLLSSACAQPYVTRDSFADIFASGAGENTKGNTLKSFLSKQRRILARAVKAKRTSVAINKILRNITEGKNFAASAEVRSFKSRLGKIARLSGAKRARILGALLKDLKADG